MLRSDVRAAARQEDGMGNLENGADVRHTGTDRDEQRLALGNLDDRRRVFAADGIVHVTFDQLSASRYDNDWTTHAASSPATSLSVRSRTRPITASASSNCCCVQINDGAVSIVSKTCRMMKPSRKKWSRQISPTRPGSAKRLRVRLSATSSIAPRSPIERTSPTSG